MSEYPLRLCQKVREPTAMSPSRFVAVLLIFVVGGPPLGAVTVSLAGGLAARLFARRAVSWA